MSRLLRTPLAVVACLTLLAAGCNRNQDAETLTSATTSTDPVSITRLFTGTLTPGDTQFYSFTLGKESDIILTLASVVPVGSREASTAPLRLSLGVPRAMGCEVSSTVLTPAALAAQIREKAAPGIYCAAVSDPGSLRGEMTFAVRIGFFQ